MSMIFDRFKTPERAEAFIGEVKRQYGLDGKVFTDEAEAFAHDPFPFDLHGVIAHVDRSEIEEIGAAIAVEESVARFASGFGGVFVGT